MSDYIAWLLLKESSECVLHNSCLDDETSSANNAVRLLVKRDPNTSRTTLTYIKIIDVCRSITDVSRLVHVGPDSEVLL